MSLKRHCTADLTQVICLSDLATMFNRFSAGRWRILSIFGNPDKAVSRRSIPGLGFSRRRTHEIGRRSAFSLSEPKRAGTGAVGTVESAPKNATTSSPGRYCRQDRIGQPEHSMRYAEQRPETCYRCQTRLGPRGCENLPTEACLRRCRRGSLLRPVKFDGSSNSSASFFPSAPRVGKRSPSPTGFMTQSEIASIRRRRSSSGAARVSRAGVAVSFRWSGDLRSFHERDQDAQAKLAVRPRASRGGRFPIEISSRRPSREQAWSGPSAISRVEGSLVPVGPREAPWIHPPRRRPGGGNPPRIRQSPEADRRRGDDWRSSPRTGRAIGEPVSRRMATGLDSTLGFDSRSFLLPGRSGRKGPGLPRDPAAGR